MDERARSAGAWQSGSWNVVSRLVEVDGSAAHPWFQRLVATGAQQRDLADAAHSLCILYGQQPGLADEALAHDAVPDAVNWLADAAGGFAEERAYLAALVAGAGPLPSTPGHAETRAAIATQAHALSMLARSDRGGCAVGAVAALIGDWRAIRRLLDIAALRFAVQSVPATLSEIGDPGSAPALFGSAFATAAPVDRAVAFGAQQLLAQHRGLWSLLEARASARHG